jgi:Ca2+-binding RTX toxin-like protein
MRRHRYVVVTLVVIVSLLGVGVEVAQAEARPKCHGRRATIVGTKGKDRIRGTRRADVIVAKGGNDRISGRGGKDVICAGDGNDIVMGDGGADGLDGGQGSDVLSGGPGDDFIGGGTGLADAVDYLTGAKDPVEVNLPAGIARGRGRDELDGIENVTGTPFDDAIYGNDLANALVGDGGDDTILGNRGPDFITPGAGDDTVNGGGDPDTVDYFFSNPRGPITIDLFGAVGTATGQGTDSLESIEAAGGGEFDDTMLGDNGQNAFFGFDGDDTLRGAVGANDIVQGGLGNDLLDGGTGTGDTADFRSLPEGAAAVQVSLLSGTATGQGTDMLEGIEKVNGSDFSDSITGDDSENTLFGFDGDDTIAGLGGNDFISGGAGYDSLDGGDGEDDCLSGEENANCEFDFLRAERRRRMNVAQWSRPMLMTVRGGLEVQAYSRRR